jgi:pentatricopeptide repeat protein
MVEMFCTEMKLDGIVPDVAIFGAILDCYAKSGNLTRILILLKEMKESSVELDIYVWTIIMDGLPRAEGQENKKKSLSIWKYLSGQRTHESLGLDIPEKASTVLPNAATLAIAFDICRKGSAFDIRIKVFQRY